MIKKVISIRRLVQGIVGLSIYFLISYFNLNLLYVILFGSILGIIFGKVFCRWMCPIGFLMELLIGKSSSSKNLQLYNYHKLGCPIAWISGMLNKVSLIKISRNKDSCTDCGICDKACYISSINKDYSLYKKNKLNPSKNYSCSKCLECVKQCPTNSLSYKI